MPPSRYSRQARRATVGVNVLDAAALLCLAASATFWLNLYWSLLAPPLLSVSALIAVSMGLVYALVLPVLWSMLIPSTPAGMLLQSTKTRTWGFIFVVAASVYLTFHAWTVLSAWWSVQPNVQLTGQDLWMAIACLIAFIGIPALAWVQATPEQWVAQIRQAHLVRRLKIQHAADIAILKTTLLRAQQKAAVGVANLMSAERQELVDTLRALFEGQNETLRAIAGTFRDVADVELSFRVSDEDELAQGFNVVADELERASQLVKTGTNAPVLGDSVAQPAGVANASQRVERAGAVSQGNAGQRTTTHDNGEPYAVEYDAARSQLRPTWSAKQLAAALGVEESTARGILGERSAAVRAPSPAGLGLAAPTAAGLEQRRYPGGRAGGLAHGGAGAAGRLGRCGARVQRGGALPLDTAPSSGGASPVEYRDVGADCGLA